MLLAAHGKQYGKQASCRRTPYPVPCLSVVLPSIITVDTVVDTPVGTTVDTGVSATVSTTVNTAVDKGVSATVDTAVSIAFSNAVRAERSEDRHRMTPIGVLRQ